MMPFQKVDMAEVTIENPIQENVDSVLKAIQAVSTI